MKRIGLLVCLYSIIFQAGAQYYLIDFTGSGASTTVDMVEVYNLDQDTGIILSGVDTLLLGGTVGLSPAGYTAGELRVFPNPVYSVCQIEVFNPSCGAVLIDIADIAGKTLLQRQDFLPEGYHIYKLDGLGAGTYQLVVNTEMKRYGASIISLGGNRPALHLSHQYHKPPEFHGGYLKKANAHVEMQYNDGERILFKGISGNYARVLTLVPTQSQAVDFLFVPCTDADTNHYAVVSIGSQTWMQQDLKATRYTDGTFIEYIGNDNTAWSNCTGGAFTWYDDDIQYKDLYAGLYNWYAVTSPQGVCPQGWHLPSDSEWAALATAVGTPLTGSKLKSTRQEPKPHPRWDSPNTSASNHFGFSSLPGGCRESYGYYLALGEYGYYWSADEYNVALALFRNTYYHNTYFYAGNTNKAYGLSVRCVKD